MRSTIIATLCILAPALCTPVPIVLIDSLEAVAGAAHPPAPVAKTRPQHALPRVVFDDDEDEIPTGIDNSEMVPSPTMTPSQVLAAHRPLETSYLLSLHPWYRLKGKPSATNAEITSAAAGLSAADLEALEAMEGARIGMPCYSRMSKVERSDFVAICLIFLFAMVVVVVETFASVKQFFSRRGAIRLQEDEPRRQKQALSVRADTLDFTESPLVEKTAL